MFYVYVLRSETDFGFYISYSANLKKRFSEHVAGTSFATSDRRPWRLIYYEAYLNQTDALGRERYLKSGAGRRFLTTQLRHYLAQNSGNRVGEDASMLRSRVNPLRGIRTCSVNRASG